MGVSVIRYVVLGVVVTDKTQVKDFFRITENLFEIMKAYADNAYEDEITANASGIHVIADGMSGEYVVVGKILAKGDLSVLSFIEVSDIDEQYKKCHCEIVNLDRLLGTRFSELKARLIVLTHWH